MAWGVSVNLWDCLKIFFFFISASKLSNRVQQQRGDPLPDSHRGCGTCVGCFQIPALPWG